MSRDLSRFFNPASVAIVGASRTTEKVGAIVLRNVRESGFRGKVYPINPNTSSIDDLPCYPSVTALPDPPDLVAIALPAPLVTTAIEDGVKKGVVNFIVFSAGFKEAGEEGKVLEDRLLSLVRDFHLNVLGPNCLGFVNNACPINVTFGQTTHRPGNLRFISQSGAIAASLFDWCSATGLGFSEFITLGNKVDIDEIDILDYWLNAPPASSPDKDLSRFFPIGLYLESITHGREFVDLTQKLSPTTPLFLLKPGKSQAAALAMQSHTGAIAGEDAVLEAAARQSGVIRCSGLQEFFDLSRAFAWENPPSGGEVAVVSNAGGPSVLIADEITGAGLSLVELDEETHRQLEVHLPRSASIINPIDVLGDALADRYKIASEIILKDPQAKTLLVLLTPQVMTQIEQTAQYISELSKTYEKPIFCSFIGGTHTAAGEAILNADKIASFHFPERAVKVISLMWQWQSWRESQGKESPAVFLPPPRNQDINTIFATAKEKHWPALPLKESLQVLLAAGVISDHTAAVKDFNSAKEYAAQIGWPVVLKLSSPALIHKTETGSVKLGINNDQELTDAWNKLNDTRKQTNQESDIIMQKQVGPGVEVITGVKRDPSFGPVLLFGAGGVLAELIADRNLHLLPMSRDEILDLITQSKIYPVLNGYRGHQLYAINKLADTILSLTSAALTYPEIAEVEINPVIVTSAEAIAVDARIILI
jgi:acyl-CoA synthetase (NDP forming)